LAAKNFIDVGAGVVDEDYRGPLGVVLFNHADVPFEVKQGDRIAQVLNIVLILFSDYQRLVFAN
jgi:dUTP pyrophosphatase